MTWRLPSTCALERAPDLAALSILRAAAQVAQIALLAAHDSLPIEDHEELPPPDACVCIGAALLGQLEALDVAIGRYEHAARLNQLDSR
jgi:hypothetical protein